MRDTPTWTLRKSNGTTFGPVELPELRKWAAEGRIVAGNEASRDGRSWSPVEDIPDLEMNWMACRSDGKVSGPFNIRAIPALLHHGVLDMDTRLEHTTNGRELRVPDVLEEMGIEVPRDNGSDDQIDGNDPDQEQAVNEKLSEEIDALRCQLEEEQVLAADREQALQAQVKELKEQLKQATGEAAPLKEALDNARQRLKELAESDTSSAESLAQAHTDVKTLGEQLETATVERDAALAECEALKEAVSSLQEQLAVAQKSLDETGTRLDEATEAYESDIQEARANAKTAQVAATEAQQAQAQLQSQLSEAITRAQNAEAALAQEQQRIAQQTEKAKAKLHELRDQVIFMRKNNASMQSEMERLRHRLARLIKFSLIGFIAVLVALAMTTIFSSKPRSTGDQTGTEAAPGGSGELVHGVEPPSDAPGPDTSETVAPPRASDLPPEDETGADVLPPPTVPWPTLRGDGFTQKVRGNELSIVFKAPLFASLARLSEAGQTELRGLAKQIEETLPSFTLIVEGHTDNDPVRGVGGYNDNYSLGKARADAARTYLVETCGLPASSVRAISVGETHPPFPNDTPENKRRNRTAVLKLLRK